jgi:hypothetical protein
MTMLNLLSEPRWLIVLCLGVWFFGSAGCGDNRSGKAGHTTRGVVTCCQTPDTLFELVKKAVETAGGDMDSVFRSTLAGEAAALPAPGVDTSIIVPLLKKIFNEWQIVFDPHDSSIGASLPQSVYENKKGACLGIALLMLLLGEKNGYPLYGVVIPGHFFVRYDDGAIRRNIEPNASGLERTDDYYRSRYGVGPGSWYFPLRNLSKPEVAGVLFFMIGNDALRKKQWRKACGLYETCLGLYPDYPDALGNLAVALAERNRVDSAITLLDRAARINPGDRKIWLNKALLFMRTNRYQEMVRLCGERLHVAPDDRELSEVCFRRLLKMKRYAEADSIVWMVRTSGDTVHADALVELMPGLSRK